MVSEFQLPVIERVEALALIKNNKSKYLDLMKTNVDIPEWIKIHVENEIRDKKSNKRDAKSNGHDLVDIIFQVNSSLSQQIHLQEMFMKKDAESESEDDVPGMKSEDVSGASNA